MRDLTGKQRAGIEYYCDIGSETYNNAYRSLRKAAYSEGYARHRAGDWLSNVVVKQAMEAKRAEIAEKMDVTRQEVIDNARWLVKFGKANGRTTAVSQGNEQLGKVADVFSETTNVTDTQRQRELDEMESEECRKIAQIRLRAFKSA